MAAAVANDGRRAVRSGTNSSTSTMSAKAVATTGRRGSTDERESWAANLRRGEHWSSRSGPTSDDGDCAADGWTSSPHSSCRVQRNNDSAADSSATSPSPQPALNPARPRRGGGGRQRRGAVVGWAEETAGIGWQLGFSPNPSLSLPLRTAQPSMGRHLRLNMGNLETTLGGHPNLQRGGTTHAPIHGSTERTHALNQ